MCKWNSFDAFVNNCCSDESSSFATTTFIESTKQREKENLELKNIKWQSKTKLWSTHFDEMKIKPSRKFVVFAVDRSVKVCFVKLFSTNILCIQCQSLLCRQTFYAKLWTYPICFRSESHGLSFRIVSRFDVVKKFSYYIRIRRAGWLKNSEHS